MRRLSVVSTAFVLLLITLSVFQFGCNQSAPVTTADTASAPKTLSHADLVARGKYIVTTAACSDCHSPKVFTPMGPVPDSSKSLSGHPAGSPNLPIDKKVLTPGGWLLIGPDLTMFVGPFGASYAANLTPDTATGLGAWTEEVFVKTMRTGKHLGQDGGRPILPPMPWPSIAQYTDEDLKAIFTYLQSLPPISNKVPAPLTPPDIAKMK
jgi:hypothetical protein